MRTLAGSGFLIALSALGAAPAHAQASGSIRAVVQVVDVRPSSRLVQAGLRLRRASASSSGILQRRDLAGATILLDRPPAAADTGARRVTIIHW